MPNYITTFVFSVKPFNERKKMYANTFSAYEKSENSAQ